MSDSLHGDPGARIVVDTRAIPWAPSPSGSVWRRRVHRVGPAESGQVTALVRYEPGAEFPVHDHPEGEEFLVLEGVFSDEHGDWPAGTWVQNPEGFRHAPFSREGCLLFVKLRQAPGRERRQLRVDTGAQPWIATAETGVSRKPLFAEPGFPDETALERFDPGTVAGTREHEAGAEILVLEGAFSDEHGRYGEGTWLRLPAGSSHAPRSDDGATLYVKRGGLALLRSG